MATAGSNTRIPSSDRVIRVPKKKRRRSPTQLRPQGGNTGAPTRKFRRPKKRTGGADQLARLRERIRKLKKQGGGGKGGGGTKQRGLLSPYTRRELRDLVESDVDFEIGEAVSPLERAAERYGDERTRAMGELQSLYGTVLPWVSGAAERVGEFSEQSRADEQAIYEAARQRLGALGQTRASEAQGLAQTLGAPIPVEGFTEPVSAASQQFEGTTAAEQLASIGGSQADVDAIEAFAGQVLPMMRLEQSKDIGFRYDEAIEQVEDEIAHIKSQRGKLINTQFADRLLAERQFALQKLQMGRDYEIAKGTLGLQKGELTGKYKGKPTLAKQQMKQQQRQFMSNLRENQRQFNIQAAQQQQALQQSSGGKGARAEKRAQAFALASALTSPGKPETYTYTAFVEVPEGTTGAFKDPQSGKWVKAQSITEALPQKAIRSPLQLYQALIREGVPKNIALQVTRVRMGAKKWNPRNPWNLSPGARKRPRTIRGGD